MPSEYRHGYIYVQGVYCGKIEETEEGYQFSYDADYLRSKAPLPVSLTLPLSEKPYRSHVLFPFFDGLIPEGWLLNVVSRNWKIPESDRFGIMLAACRDCIGDVSIETEKR